MATLDGISLNYAGTIKTPDGFNVDVWSARLSGEATDTFTVPGVSTTNGAAILLKGLGEDPVIPVNPADVSRTPAQASITVAVAARAEGDSIVTVTNSASPRRRNQVIITTLRQRVGSNNATIDEDPT